MVRYDRYNTCLLCGSDKIASLKGYEQDYLVKCRECKFVFSVRRPSDRELADHYGLYPRATTISEITLQRYEELLDSFEKFRKTNNLIDIGCGDGHFLVVAKKRNWNVFGTEFTEEAIDVCRRKGIQMSHSPVKLSEYKPGSFDVVTSFEVLEHINKPHEELQVFHNLLRKGGVVYVTTPNWNSVSRDILNSTWNVIEYPEHLCYYTRQTLNNLFSRCNFKKLGISSTGISMDRLRAGRQPEKGATASNVDEKLRQRTEKKILFKLLKISINGILNFTGKGDSIKGIFQRQ